MCHVSTGQKVYSKMIMFISVQNNVNVGIEDTLSVCKLCFIVKLIFDCLYSFNDYHEINNFTVNPFDENLLFLF